MYTRQFKAEVIWRVQVGRVPLYLLDTNVAENARPEDRDLTDRLYGGDQEYRIRQEILLGIGGVRALETLGIRPMVYHMNEGHSAFLVLERIRRLMGAHGMVFAEAYEAFRAGNVFTTHTSVPAGIDMFPYELMDKYFAAYWGEVGISREEFLALGRRADDAREFCMAALALRGATFANGVSEMHGGISRNMWRGVWPRVLEHEVPITSITNGVHARSWISKDMAALFHRYLGPRWTEDPLDGDVWDRIDKIPDEELWRTHERRRERLVAYARRCLRTQLERRGAPRSEIQAADEALDPSALTIGFARRFATYKRADLVLTDPERLAALMSDRERPVQIIYAGKAHPKDNDAKNILRKIIHLSQEEPFRGRIVFIEDYSVWVSRYLIQGVDLWLNTPRRMNEASGTSGMKAGVNGAINMSILDGWWDEAYDAEVGWAIGQREMYQDLAYQDMVESNAIYQMLEQEVIPMFYERGPDKLPRRWIARMKASMRTVCPMFNTNRMVHDYHEKLYRPAADLSRRLSAEDYARARALAAWKARLRSQWESIRIVQASSERDTLEAGAELAVLADVHLGALAPEEVSVQIYYGSMGAGGEIAVGEIAEMAVLENKGDGTYLFSGTIPCTRSGLYGYAVRVLPRHEDLGNPLLMNLIAWT